MLHTFKTADASQTIGLQKQQIFPNLKLKNDKNESVELKTLITQKTVIMIQPGASHKGQWDGLPDALDAWKAFTDPTEMYECVAGCTGHLLGFIQKYFEYKSAGYNIVVIMSNKTAEQLDSLEKEKASPFPLHSLTPDSFAELQRLQQPVFKFEGQDYVYRNTWAVTPEMQITHSTDSTTLTADKSKDEAANFLNELKK